MYTLYRVTPQLAAMLGQLVTNRRLAISIAIQPRALTHSVGVPPCPRVIQLGLRKDALAAFKGPAFGEGGIEDVTAFTKATAARHGGGRKAGSLDGLLLPAEELYPVENARVSQRLGVD